MRALIYARVSTADKEQDPRPQLEEMREFSRYRKWSVALEETDKVSSADDRPGFQRIMAAARARKGDVIVCRHFDRVARTTKELLEILDECGRLGVEFTAVNQQIDTTTAAGRLFFTIIAAFAEFERSMIRERVRLGLADARKHLAEHGRTRKGKTRFAGRPRCELDIAKIRMLWQSGESTRAIAKEVKVSPSTIRRVLKSPYNAPKTRLKRCPQVVANRKPMARGK